MLTVGGRARHLPIHGGDKALYLRTIEDARLIRARLATARRVICIGAGVIGLEIASSARKRGAEVTVLEALPRAMGRSVSPEGAAFVETLHRDAGVALQFRRHCRCNRGCRPGRACASRCRGGGEFIGDIVIAGVGMQRHLALAERAGLALEGGIVVDEFGRTSAPDIYAAGDVTAFHHPLFDRRLRLESWRHAQNHGIAVGKAMCGDSDGLRRYPVVLDRPAWGQSPGGGTASGGGPHGGARQRAARACSPRCIWPTDDSVIGVTAANNPRDMRVGQALIKARCVVDPAAAADPAVPLQRLIRA